MSSNLSDGYRVVTVADPGRSTGSSKRRLQDGGIPTKDRGFKRYAAGIERVLSSIDNPQQEWADYISFLGRLMKALQAHPNDVTRIPHGSTIALRLGQCMNPRLPSGVHQKALEVYSYIFSLLDVEELSQEYAKYFPGLAHTLSFASLNLRPLFLSLIETHLLRLEASTLRPALKALILSLLPGLEEENNEDFDRVMAILTQIQKKTEAAGPEGSTAESSRGYFWHCFFLACITVPPRRTGALIYLMKNLPKLTTGLIAGPSSKPENRRKEATFVNSLTEAGQAISQPQPGLLLRCYIFGLCDSQSLVQRGFLDLLLTHLPLHSIIIQELASKDDTEALVNAAASIVLRRDMSLNRRLWLWLLGPDENETVQDSELAVEQLQQDSKSRYFQRYGLRYLSTALLKLLSVDGTRPVAGMIKPFRICLSMMDRWEVGGSLIPSIFLPALEYAYSQTETKLSVGTEEVLRSANSFFDGVESEVIWRQLLLYATDAIKAPNDNEKQAVRKLNIFKFVITQFNIREEEMIERHIPLTISGLLALIYECLTNNNEDHTSRDVIIEMSLEIVDVLVIQISPRHDTAQDAALHVRNTKEETEPEVYFDRIRKIYDEDTKHNSSKSLEVLCAEASQKSVQLATRIYVRAISSTVSEITLYYSTRILSTLLSKVSEVDTNMQKLLMECLQMILRRHHIGHTGQASFQRLSSACALLISLALKVGAHNVLNGPQAHALFRTLFQQLWLYLSPDTAKYHMEVAGFILQLHQLSASERIAEAVFTSLLSFRDSDNAKITFDSQTAHFHRFGVLWGILSQQIINTTERAGRNNLIRTGGSSFAAASATDPSQALDHILLRPLLLVIEQLQGERFALSADIRIWLRKISPAEKVFDLLVAGLEQTETGACRDSNSDSSASLDAIDVPKVVYLLENILQVLKALELSYSDPTTVPTYSSEFLGKAVSSHLQILQYCINKINHSLAHNNDALLLWPLVLQIISELLKSVQIEKVRRREIGLSLLQALLKWLELIPSDVQYQLLHAISIIVHLDSITAIESPPRKENGTSPTAELSIDKAQVSTDQPGVDRKIFESQSFYVLIVKSIKRGISLSFRHSDIEIWVLFLTDVLPQLVDTVFNQLVSLVDCFCKRIYTVFEQLKATYTTTSSHEAEPDIVLYCLINGLEQVLAKAHACLNTKDIQLPKLRSTEQPQSFLGNVVSNVFATETQLSSGSATKNRRLILLGFHDTVRISFIIWHWGSLSRPIGLDRLDPSSAATLSYVSVKLRNRARRLLDHLFAAETLECLESLITPGTHWIVLPNEKAAIISLLQVLNSTRPKVSVMTLFNAIYSRTKPNALEATRKSSLISELAEIELATFMISYMASLEDDAMDEIWEDCIAFLRDVLSNPLPQRRILPLLLEFTTLLAEKIENTNFGDQPKMKRELGDVFQRLLTAILTTKLMILNRDSQPDSGVVKKIPTDISHSNTELNLFQILSRIVPRLSVLYPENDRLSAVMSTLCNNVTGPSIKSKQFPNSLAEGFLSLLFEITRTATISKPWKKDIFEAFFDARFLSIDSEKMRSVWFDILRQWIIHQKDCLAELLSRLSTPTTAGLLFGVGATSARLEADHKTQFSLRRLALLIMAAGEENLLGQMSVIEEKLGEVISATSLTSPSSATRADVFLVFRALVLKLPGSQLDVFWPILTSELRNSLHSIFPDSPSSTIELYNTAALLQALKLLDTVLLVSPEDFHLHEWLFICDTVDAEYRPEKIEPVALVDQLAQVLRITSEHLQSPRALMTTTGQVGSTPVRSSYLEAYLPGNVSQFNRNDLVATVVKPFVNHLSIAVYEAKYNMEDIDFEACAISLLDDLLDPTTLLK